MASSYHLQLASLGVVAYFLVQRWLRFKRVKDVERHYGYPNRPLSNMTEVEAQMIQKELAQIEFPLAFKKSLQFALFRTYGIPSISKLLMKTKQFSNSAFAPKRYSDTGVLVDEIYARPATDPRVREAFGRLNFIHGLYRNSGQISNDDMLYTLSLFAWEPVKWINRIEWRQLTDFEVAAIGTFIKGMGESMEISFAELSSSKTGFTDGLHFMRELQDWAEAYEERCMVPHIDNHKTAEETTALLIRELPTSLRTYGKTMVTAVMDDRLRKAMMYEPPPRIYKRVLDTVFSLRKTFLRYMALPRPRFMRVENTTNEMSAEGRYFVKSYDAYPFYVKPSFAGRWSVGAWFKWAVGLPLPGDDGEIYHSNGYKIEEIGPKSLLGKGTAASKLTQEKLARERVGGCPFGPKI